MLVRAFRAVKGVSLSIYLSCWGCVFFLRLELRRKRGSGNLLYD